MKYTNGQAIPVLYIQNGENFIVSLTCLLYLNARQGKSDTWKREFVRSLGFFIDYFYAAYDAHKNKPGDIQRALMNGFLSALKNGTIDIETGTDPFGLFWPTASLAEIKKTYRYLKNFIEWCSDEKIGIKKQHDIDVSVNETAPIQFLNQAILIKKYNTKHQFENLKNIALASKNNDFLSHGFFPKNSSIIQFQSNPFQFKFPEELVAPLFMHGFKTDKSMYEVNSNLYSNSNSELAIDAMLDFNAYMISALLFFSGLRVSEPFHLWFNDIMYKGSFECDVKLRHPSDSVTFMIGEPTNKTRGQYLLERGMRPRNTGYGNYNAGWKNLKTDSMNQADCYFLHSGIEAAFRQMHELYIRIYRRNMINERIKRGLSEHPFLFVSSGFDGSTNQSCAGNPFTMKAYVKKFNHALDLTEKAIGEKIPRGKKYGTTPHGARHFCASLLVEASVPPGVIQNVLRHRSIFSQDAYTQETYKKLLANLKPLKDRMNSTMPLGGIDEIFKVNSSANK